MSAPRRRLFASNADVLALVAAFDGCRLPKDDWTHQAHLVVALAYVQRLGVKGAWAALPDHIRAYNIASGTANTDTGGYHHTITHFSLQATAAFLARLPAATPLHEAVMAYTLHPLGAKDLPLQFYSRDKLFTPQARHNLIEPDLRPLSDLAHLI